MKHSLENIKRKITTNKKPETPAGISGVPSIAGTMGSSGIMNGSSGLGGGSQTVPAASDIELLNRQICVLTHNQQQIEIHMERFTAQYHVSETLFRRSLLKGLC